MDVCGMRGSVMAFHYVERRFVTLNLVRTTDSVKAGKRKNGLLRWLAMRTACAVAVAAVLGLPPVQSAGPLDLGVHDPRLTRLFTPPAAPPGIYQVFRSPRPIADLAAAFRALDPAPVAGAWRVAPLGPADAFGTTGAYDAPMLARLYVGALPRVARGSLRTAEGLVAYTLIAPWPDADLKALQPGTMVIVFHVTALTGLR
jgi:hypothetical protein